MKAIDTQVKTFLSNQPNKFSKVNINQIRDDKGIEVNGYVDLIEYIAKISYLNPHFAIFFRGQSNDYLNTKKRTTIKPAIFRNDSSNSLKDALEISENNLLYEITNDKFFGKSKILLYREIRWAILQHYEIIKTPVVDITSSLNVAISFALQKEKVGYLYLLGLPRIYSPFATYIEESFFLIQLSSVCPPSALRPFLQEAYSVGNMPPIDNDGKLKSFDIAYRLIAKFKLNNTENTFKIIEENLLKPDKSDKFFKYSIQPKIINAYL